jgi:biotin carboxylase
MTTLIHRWKLVKESAPMRNLLLIGSGDPGFRRYALDDLSQRYAVWLLTPKEPTWEREYLTGYAAVDITDSADAVALARALAQDTGVDGVMSYTETLVELSCAIAAELNLPSSTVDSVARGRDKLRVRQCLAEHGVPQPGFGAATTEREALHLLDEVIGYPAVLKPRRLAGSCGVVRVDGPHDVAEWFAVASSAQFHHVENPVRDTVLIEQFLEGEEISVDSACQGGVVTPLVIARKGVGFEPFFEEMSHAVSADDPLYRSVELRDLLHTVHQALGLDDLMTHTEIRLTSEGLRLIELNVRMGGDMIPYLGQLALGISLPLVAAGIAVGEKPDLARRSESCAYIELLYPPHDLVLESVHVEREQLDAAVHSVVITKEPGATLRLPPLGNAAMCRYGYAIATGPNLDDCRDSVRNARKLIHITGRPPADDNV